MPPARFKRSEAVLGRFGDPPAPQILSLARPCIAKSCTPAIDSALSLAKAHHHPQTSTLQRENAACWENVNMRDRQRENRAHHGHVEFVCSVYVCVGRDALLPTPGRRAGSLSTIPNYECMAGLGVLARYEQDAVSSRTNN